MPSPHPAASPRPPLQPAPVHLHASLCDTHFSHAQNQSRHLLTCTSLLPLTDHQLFLPACPTTCLCDAQLASLGTAPPCARSRFDPPTNPLRHLGFPLYPLQHCARFGVFLRGYFLPVNHTHDLPFATHMIWEAAGMHKQQPHRGGQGVSEGGCPAPHVPSGLPPLLPVHHRPAIIPTVWRTGKLGSSQLKTACGY